MVLKFLVLMRIRAREVSQMHAYSVGDTCTSILSTINTPFQQEPSQHSKSDSKTFRVRFIFTVYH